MSRLAKSLYALHKQVLGKMVKENSDRDLKVTYEVLSSVFPPKKEKKHSHIRNIMDLSQISYRMAYIQTICSEQVCIDYKGI